MPIKKSSGFPAARRMDPISCGEGIIVGGEDTVLIGSEAKPIACKDCKAKKLLNEGYPVNVSYGSKILPDEIDFALPAPLAFVWQRFYASDTVWTGILGQGWRTPIELHVVADETSTCLCDIQGRTITFYALPPGQEQQSPSEGVWIARGTADKTIPWEERWQWLPERYRHNPDLIVATPGDGTYLVFDAVNKPVPSKDDPHPVAYGRFDLVMSVSRHGYVTRLQWTTMHNDANQPVRVPEWITDSAGRIYRLHYQRLRKEDEREWSAHHPEPDPGIRLSGVNLAYDPLRDADAPRDLSALRDLRAREWLVQYRYSKQGDLIEVLDGEGDNARTFEYEQHLMTRQQTPGGLDVRYQYDRYEADGKVIRQTQAGGLTLDFFYADNETRVTDSLGRTTLYRFKGKAGLRRPVEIVYPDGGTVKMDHTRDGRLSTLIDPLGRKTTYMRNGLGEQTSINTVLGQRSETYYDQATGFVTSTRNPEGVYTYFTHDALGNITEVKVAKFAGARGGTTRYEYGHPQFPDRPTVIVDARGGKKHLTYDGLGQLHTYTDCSGHTSTWQRDRKGRLIAIEQADGKRQTYRRDTKGRIVAVDLPDGKTEAFEYDRAGRLAKARDAEGRPVAFSYDRFDRIVEHRTWTGEGAPESDNSPGWSRTRQTFDEAGRMSRLIDPAGATMVFGYDAMDRLISEIGFDGKRSRYDYNLAGEMTRHIDGAGTSAALTIIHERDAGGRLIARHLPACDGHPADTHRFEYNKRNQITCATTACSRVDFFYDDLNRLAAETQSADDGSSFTVRYGYDVLGNRNRTILPDGHTIDILMAGGGHWHQVAFNGHPLADVERDSLHRETVRTFGSGAYLGVEHPLTRNLRYTGAGQLDSVAYSRGGRVSEQWQHHYAPTGLLVRIDQDLAELRKVVRFAYDRHERLAAWDVHEAPQPEGTGPYATRPEFQRTQAAEYGHDPAGNPILPGTVIRTDPVSNMPVYVPPKEWEELVRSNADNPDFNLLGMTPVRANRIAQLGDCFHTYNERGNVVQRRTPEGSWVFAWDALNRMTGSRFTPAGSSEAIYDATYFHDAFGRRIAKTVLDLRTLVLKGDGNIDFDQTKYCPVRYVWDGDRLLQEIHIDHAKTIVYEPGTFVPLAQIIQPKREGEPLVRVCSESGEFQIRALEQLNVSMVLANPDVPEEGKRQLRTQLGADSPYRNEDMQIHLFLTDHLGTPFRMVDAATHEPVWERLQDPSGKTYLERWHSSVNKNYLPALRYQGQQYDWETGLFYNRYRHYDPLMRRYLSQDPIGLWGGFNFYGYPVNPVQWIDPLGLEKLILLPPNDINYPAAVAEPDIPGQLTIYSHGSPTSVSGKSAADLEKEIRKKTKWKKGMPIVLNSCRTAEGDDNIAKQLSKKMKTKVTGANARMLTAGKYDMGPWHSVNIPGTDRTIPYWPGEMKTYSNGVLVK